MPSKDANEKPPLPQYPGGYWVAGLLIAYVAFVLLADTLATLRVQTPIDWNSLFQWKPRHLVPYLTALTPEGRFETRLISLLNAQPVNALDLFKLFAWFIIPVLFSLRWMDWEAWLPFRWKRMDWALLVLALVGAVVVVVLIPYIPGVREYYKPSQMSSYQKWMAVLMYNLWCLCWLPGWEFLHRYVLLAALGKFFPRGGWGWIVVPLLVATSELAYHLVKPWPEAAAMFGFGFVASLWAYQRSNWLLPLIAHWCVEMALILFLVLAA